MAEKRIVVVSGEACRFEWLSRELTHEGVGCVCGVTDIEDLAEVLADGQISLVVLVRRGANDRTRVARTLWHVSRSRRPVPVVVVDDVYSESAALRFLRMGASEYLSVAEHRDKIGKVIASLVALEPVVEAPVVAEVTDTFAQLASEAPQKSSGQPVAV